MILIRLKCGSNIYFRNRRKTAIEDLNKIKIIVYRKNANTLVVQSQIVVLIDKLKLVRCNIYTKKIIITTLVFSFGFKNQSFPLAITNWQYIILE